MIGVLLVIQGILVISIARYEQNKDANYKISGMITALCFALATAFVFAVYSTVQEIEKETSAKEAEKIEISQAEQIGIMGLGNVFLGLIPVLIMHFIDKQPYVSQQSDFQNRMQKPA